MNIHTFIMKTIEKFNLFDPIHKIAECESSGANGSSLLIQGLLLPQAVDELIAKQS